MFGATTPPIGQPTQEPKLLTESPFSPHPPATCLPSTPTHTASTEIPLAPRTEQTYGGYLLSICCDGLSLFWGWLSRSLGSVVGCGVVSRRVAVGGLPYLRRRYPPRRLRQRRSDPVSRRSDPNVLISHHNRRIKRPTTTRTNHAKKSSPPGSAHHRPRSAMNQCARVATPPAKWRAKLHQNGAPAKKN